MKPQDLVIVNEAKGNVNLYSVRVEVGGVPLWTGVHAENVERANRIAEKLFGKGKVRGRPTKVKESKDTKGPHNKVEKGSQKRYKHALATDKPDKYIGKWEAYDEPQGINSKAGQKMVHAESEVMPDVKTYTPEQIAKKHGVDIRKIMAQLRMGVKAEFEHTENRKLAQEIALDHLLEMPDYYTRLEQMEEGHSMGPEFSRGLNNSSTGSGAVPPATDFDPKELPNPLRPGKKLPGAKAPGRQVSKTVNKSIKNKVRKPNSPVTEMVRLPIQTKFNADYEIKDGEKTIGMATVTDGVIEDLKINQDAADEQFNGHALSTTLGTIIRDADLQGANLAMKIVDIGDQDMKRFIERFGFRHTGDGVMKRTAGAITPPSVIEKNQE